MCATGLVAVGGLCVPQDKWQWPMCAAGLVIVAYVCHRTSDSKVKVKVKSSMARSLPVENLLPQNVGSIINYLQ